MPRPAANICAHVTTFVNIARYAAHRMHMLPGYSTILLPNICKKIALELRPNPSSGGPRRNRVLERN